MAIIAKKKARDRIVHGWAFRGHPPVMNDAIRKFLSTGDTRYLPEQYQTDDGDYSSYERPSDR